MKKKKYSLYTSFEFNDKEERGYALADGKQITHHQFAHDYYFMAGDNVMNSNDSRYWGLVPKEFIIGVATHIFYSKDNDSESIRKERFMKKIQGVRE